jgi:hypothetical protein
MKATAKSTGNEGRIVNLSSIAHHHTSAKGIRFNDVNDKKKYGFSLSFQTKSAIDSIVANMVLYWQIQ